MLTSFTCQSASLWSRYRKDSYKEASFRARSPPYFQVGKSPVPREQRKIRAYTKLRASLLPSSWRQMIVPCKGIRIPESEKSLLMESGIRNVTLQVLLINTRIQYHYLGSGIHSVEFRIQNRPGSLTWGENDLEHFLRINHTTT